MTGSALLDLFIAMALFYFALCMVCSSANDAVARVGRWRAGNLHTAVRSMLLNARVSRKPPPGPDGTSAAKEFELADLFFNHPFVQTLRQQAELGETWTGRRLHGLFDWLSGIGRAVFGSGAARAVSLQPDLDPRTKLTAIPTPVFVRAVWEILKPDDWNPNEPFIPAAFLKVVDYLPDDTAGPLKQVLKSFATDPAQSAENLRANLAGWFDEGMAQAVGVVRAADADHVAGGRGGHVFRAEHRLDRGGESVLPDAGLRAAYATTATRLPPPGVEGEGGNTPPVNPVSDLKLGWQTTQLNEIGGQLSRAMKWTGLLITVVAVGMGAPFWHDAITRLVARRRAG